MYLVDTNVVSSSAPPKAVATTDLISWMETRSSRLFLSSVTIAEISDGIAKASRTGATRKSADLTAWLETILHLYADRVLSFDATAARIAGDLSDKARSHGQAPGLADIIIAATALSHGLTILTRNLRHFEPLGVTALDPFLALPPS